jgi:hypothetical protein
VRAFCCILPLTHLDCTELLVNDRIAVSFAALCAVTACTSTDPTGGSAGVSDSAGITIVENRGPYNEWRLAADPEVRIGTVEGDSAYQFHRVQFAGRLSDGRIVVADGSYQVRWFDPDGTFRSATGGRGSGPGEFGTMVGFILTPADTLVIHDSRNLRATWLSPAEAFVRDIPLRGIASGSQSRLLALTADDRLALSVSTTPFGELRPDFTYVRDTLSVLSASAAGIDTVVRRPGRDNAIWAAFSGGRMDRFQVFGMPFAREVAAAATADGYAIADGGTGEIRHHDWTGALTRIARQPGLGGDLLTSDDKASFVEHTVDAARQRGNTNLSVMEESARLQMDIIPEGHTMPTFAELLSDVEGRIWLRDYAPVWVEETEYAWTVFGPDGRVERRVVTPVDLRVLHVGPEYVTGVERDSLDVEYVAVHRLVPGS